MKNIRKFKTVADYEAWMSGDVVYPNVCYVAEDGRIAYNPPPPLPLFIEVTEATSTYPRITFSNTYEYSKDNVTWTSGTSSTNIYMNVGERVYFRASGLTVSSSNGIGKFGISSAKCNLGGNIMSMVYGADFDGKTEITQYQFRSLFEAANIVSASALVLPATVMTSSCYKYMFKDCTSLVDVPALPATTLAQECYNYMFSGCTSLVNAPALPATTLARYCYANMFQGCTSLAKAPELPATTLELYCYYYMFNGCTNLNYIKAMFTTTPSSTYLGSWVGGVASTGTFVKNSAATWNLTGVNGIPEGWTVELADA